MSFRFYDHEPTALCCWHLFWSGMLHCSGATCIIQTVLIRYTCSPISVKYLILLLCMHIWTKYVVYTTNLIVAGNAPSIFFSCDQAALQMVFSVRLSVCPSVCLSVCPSVRPSVTPFWLCSPHRIIMKFSGVITNDKSKVHAKGQGQRLKVKVTEVTTQLDRFRTVTPVWILIWWWNDAYSLMLLRRGALLFFKVIHQISRSHGSKNRQIWPRLGVSGL